MQRFIYKHTIHRLYPGGNEPVQTELDVELTALGSEGWEMMSVVQVPNRNDSSATVFVFWKRFAE